ncbi:MAG: cupin domain-containing protein [Candidatus Rifleibacteriota bacterium]
MIKISRPTEADLDKMGIKSWPIWEKEISKFPWHYDQKETCYILEGDIKVTPENGEPVTIKPGDLVEFPAGMSCEWEIFSPVRKHYKFG